MTVISSTNKAGPWIADGVQRQFPFSFYALTKDSISVFAGKTLLSSGYSISLASNGEGGTVTFTKAPAKGTRIAVLRTEAIDQRTDIQNNTAFHPEIVENALDKLTMVCQQLDEELGRCVKVDVASGEDPERVVDTVIGAKDLALEAANSAAKANASATAAATTVDILLSEITGDSSSVENAVEALVAAFEAAGSVEAAAAAGIAGVNAASDAAVAEAKKAIEASKDANLKNLADAADSENLKLAGLIAEAVGADGVVAAARKAAEEAAQDAKNTASGFDEVAESVKASIAAANAVAESLRDEASEEADRAAANAAAAGDSAANALKTVAETLANKNASAESALKAAEEAAKAEIAANAAAGAAGEAATTAAQQSITLHNNRVDAHSNLFNGKADKEHTHERADITDLANYLSSNLAKYLPLAGGSLTGSIKGASGSDALMLNAAQALTDGSYMRLYQKTYEDNPGGFMIAARNGDNIISLTATALGALLWGGKEVERVNNKGAKYIRFDSGLQISWGERSDIQNHSTTTTTFPQAFASIPIVMSEVFAGGHADPAGVVKVTGTYFNINTGDLYNGYMWWLAIGFWK